MSCGRRCRSVLRSITRWTHAFSWPLESRRSRSGAVTAGARVRPRSVEEARAMLANRLVTETQLDEWVRGNDRVAQEVIVELVYQLVSASCPGAMEIRFPLDGSITQHGEDGYVDTP